MPSKLQMYEQMADQTAKQVTGSFGEWTAFLETMGRLYKYPFHEQLMIFAQKPNATACADYDLWNKQMGRYVRRGTKGIALIDTSGDNPKLKYVFDVSDTGTRANSRRLNLWEYRDEHQDAVTASLENRFGVSGEKGLADQLEQIAGKLVTEYWNDNRRDILGILEDSFLEEYDDYNVEMAFRNAAAVSTTYTLMSRCGLNPGDYFEHEDFLSVFDFNTRDTIAVLGSAVSNSSEQILRQIAITVKNYEREASLQRQAERTQNDGEQSELYAERGLSDSQSDALRDRNEALGQVRSDEEKVPAGAQAGAVEQHDPVREPVSASEGDRRGSEPEAGTDDAGADEAERRDGEPESQRSDEVDRAYEQPQKPSRGSNSRRTDSRISGQLTLFDVGLFPTEQEQIAVIDEAESVKPTPFAFSFAQNDIDDVLRLASNTEDTRMTVAAAFQKQKSTEEIAELLKQEYHGGAGIKSEGGEFSVWYGEDGIHLAKGRSARYTKTAQIISWEDAAERIGQLMQDGRYASTEVSKPLHITVTGTDIDYEMSWAKVQRRIAQLIKEDRFYTQAEYDRLDDIDPIAIRETLAQHGIVNGEVVDSEKLDADPFIQQVMGDVDRISREQAAIREADEAFANEYLIPHESTFEIDGRRFVVDSVNLDFGKVSLQDVTFQNAAGFPIFRSESIAFMRGLMEISEAQRTAEPPAEPQLESETAAFYSAEENNLPFDVEIRTIKTPEPPIPKPELHNFRITDDHLGEGGAKAKFRMNMDAINLLKELEFDGRQATPEEQVILSRYVGWGGLADAFDETKDNWKSEFAELYTALSPEEYAAARSSTLNAHYIGH